MRSYNNFLSALIFVALILFGCQRFDKELDTFDDDSDAPSWAQGNKGLNDNRKQNDDTGDAKGDDYGDLYVLKRLASGVPEMGVTSLGVWYPKAVAYDVSGEPVITNGEYVTLSVNDEGEINDNTYAPHEVEFGRMNLVRSPEMVLTAALAEAISNLRAGSDITIDYCGRLVAVNGSEIDWLPGSTEEDDKTIDSPRENLAIYRELMRHGLTNQLAFLNGYGFTADGLLNMAASALAAGSDKTGTINIDEVVYINGFMEAYDEDDCIHLSDILYYNMYTGMDETCDDSYYSNLNFYNYDYSYDREALHGGKWVKVTSLNADGTYTVEVERLIEIVPFTNVRIDIAHQQNENVAGFAQACDDAVQILEYIHESSLVEYLGEHDSKPSI